MHRVRYFHQHVTELQVPCVNNTVLFYPFSKGNFVMHTWFPPNFYLTFFLIIPQICAALYVITCDIVCLDSKAYQSNGSKYHSTMVRSLDFHFWGLASNLRVDTVYCEWRICVPLLSQSVYTNWGLCLALLSQTVHTNWGLCLALLSQTVYTNWDLCLALLSQTVYTNWVLCLALISQTIYTNWGLC